MSTQTAASSLRMIRRYFSSGFCSSVFSSSGFSSSVFSSSVFSSFRSCSLMQIIYLVYLVFLVCVIHQVYSCIRILHQKDDNNMSPLGLIEVFQSIHQYITFFNFLIIYLIIKTTKHIKKVQKKNLRDIVILL